jgi:N4-gp56 family major capsid protein
MAVTTSTTLTSAIQTKFKRDVIDKITGQTILSKFAVTEGMEKGQGGTVRWPRVRRLAKQTTFNLDETSLTVTPKAITTDMVEDSIKFVGDSVEIYRAAEWNAILKSEQYKNEVADQAARTLEYLCHKYICPYGIHHRVDNDATYEVNCTVTTATSTTEFRSTDLTQIDDFWGASAAAHGYAAGTNPEAANYDASALITDFATTNDIATTTAFPQNNDTSTKLHVVRGTGIVATDVLTYTAVARVAGYHEAMDTEKFPGGVYRGIISPAHHADLYTDTTFTTIMKYVEGMKDFGKYVVFRIAGTEFVVEREMYREDADGTENTAGVVYNIPIFGAKAFAISKWEGGTGDFGLKFHFVGGIDDPDSANYWGKARWINWDASCSVKVLRATSVITLLCGATAQTIA